MALVHEIFISNSVQISTYGTSFLYEYSLKLLGLYHVFYMGVNKKIKYVNNTRAPFSFQHIDNELGGLVAWSNGRLKRAIQSFKTRFNTRYDNINNYYAYFDSNKIESTVYILPMKRVNGKLVIDFDERTHLINSERRIK